MLADIEVLIQTVTGVLDSLHITYLVGGSVASGIYGTYRFTNDLDIVADIRMEDVVPLLAALSGFHADEEMMRDAVSLATAFSIIHLELMVKVDIFVKANDPWTIEVWSRRRRLPLFGEQGILVNLPSPEDMIIQKIRWFQMGGGVSDRQWGDILGMLKTQGDQLDETYLRKWATALGLSDLLEKAIGMARPE